MRRRLAMAFLVTFFVGGAVLWERVLSTPARSVMLTLGDGASSSDWSRVVWTIERGGVEIARGAVFAREGRLPAREALGAIPLKRGPHVLRAGFVARDGEIERPPVERRVAFDVGEGDVVLLSLEGEVP